MNRRDFIAALFAGIAGSRILPADTEIITPPVILCGRWGSTTPTFFKPKTSTIFHWR